MITKENDTTPLMWLGATLWVCVCCYTVIFPPENFSVYNMLMLMPPWCQLETFNGVTELKLHNETSVMLCILFLAIFGLTLYFNLSDDVSKMTKGAQQTKEDFESKQETVEKTLEILLDNAELLLDNVDVEYQHCAASIAANNESPGQLVGGEVEWATGETDSEDEDATREVEGACLRKEKLNNSGQEEDEIKSVLQENQVNKIKTVHSAVLEPNVKTIDNIEE